MKEKNTLQSHEIFGLLGTIFIAPHVHIVFGLTLGLIYLLLAFLTTKYEQKESGKDTTV